jgi:hypothetical protein
MCDISISLLSNLIDTIKNKKQISEKKLILLCFTYLYFSQEDEEQELKELTEEQELKELKDELKEELTEEQELKDELKDELKEELKDTELLKIAAISTLLYHFYKYPNNNSIYSK